MAVVTIYRLAEQAFNLLEGGDPATASSTSIQELKISCGQVINSMLKMDYMSVNVKIGELIQNGAVLGLYPGIIVSKSTNGKSKCSLPVKPLKLPRNMGIFSIWLTGFPEKEFIPLQMGQANLIQSQPLINDLLGQVGYENFGGEILFTKDLTVSAGANQVTVDMRLAIMDISQYGDYDVLPVMPEWEMDIVTAVYKLYSSQPIPDKVVDPTVKENKGMPTKQQRQS